VCSQVFVLCADLGLRYQLPEEAQLGPPLNAAETATPALIVSREADSGMSEISELPGWAAALGSEEHHATAFLTTTQLSRLPELANCVFLHDLVRMFSEKNEQRLTLYELIDLYSAFSKAASVDWKAWTAFSLFDTTGSGVLDKVDLGRVLRLMTSGTQNTTLVGNRSYAAVRIQQYFRGYRFRTDSCRLVKQQVARRYCIDLLEKEISEMRFAGHKNFTVPLLEHNDLSPAMRTVVKDLKKLAKRDRDEALALYWDKPDVYSFQQLMNMTKRLRVNDTLSCDFTECMHCRDRLSKTNKARNQWKEIEFEKLKVLEHMLERVDRVHQRAAGKLPGGHDAVAELMLTKCVKQRGTKTGKLMSFATFERAMIEGNKSFTDNFCITCTPHKKLRKLLEQVEHNLHEHDLKKTDEVSIHAHQKLRVDVNRSLRKATHVETSRLLSTGQDLDHVRLAPPRKGGTPLTARPTIISERLKWLDVDAITQVAIGQREASSDAETSMLVHFADSSIQRSARQTVIHWLMNPISTVTKAMSRVHHVYANLMRWAFHVFLTNLEHKHGHGVREVMELAKFLIGLNVKLSMIWVVMVLLPRQMYAPLPMTWAEQLRSQFEDSESRMFYNTFNRTIMMTDGDTLHMDAIYLGALIASMVYSFQRVLKKAGRTDSAEALDSSLSIIAPGVGKEPTAESRTHGDDEVSWQTLLGDYDFTRNNSKSAIKMRQQIRRRIDDWEFDKKESASVLKNRTNKLYTYKHAFLRKRGSIMFGLLLLFYAYALVRIYADFWERLEAIQFFLPAVVINALLLLCELLLEFIVKSERGTSSERQTNFVRRTFYLKMFTMFAMFMKELTIMGSSYDNFVPFNASDAEQVVGSALYAISDTIDQAGMAMVNSSVAGLDVVVASSGVDVDVGLSFAEDLIHDFVSPAENETDVSSQNLTAGSQSPWETSIEGCAEAQTGAFYFKQLFTLSVQVALQQLVCWFLAKIGVPKFWRLWKIWTIVNHYSDEKREYRGLTFWKKKVEVTAHTGWLPFGGVRLQHRVFHRTKERYRGLLGMTEKNNKEKVEKWLKVMAPGAGPVHTDAVVSYAMKKFTLYQIKKQHTRVFDHLGRWDPKAEMIDLWYFGKLINELVQHSEVSCLDGFFGTVKGNESATKIQKRYRGFASRVMHTRSRYEHLKVEKTVAQSQVFEMEEKLAAETDPSSAEDLQLQTRREDFFKKDALDRYKRHRNRELHDMSPYAIEETARKDLPGKWLKELEAEKDEMHANASQHSLAELTNMCHEFNVAEEKIANVDLSSYVNTEMDRRLGRELRVLLSKFMNREMIKIEPPNKERYTVRVEIRKRATEHPSDETEHHKRGLSTGLYKELGDYTPSGEHGHCHNLITELEKESTEIVEQLEKDIDYDRADDDDFTDAATSGEIVMQYGEQNEGQMMSNLHVLARLFSVLPVTNLGHQISQVASKTQKLTENATEGQPMSMTELHAMSTALKDAEKEKTRRLQDDDAGLNEIDRKLMRAWCPPSTAGNSGCEGIEIVGENAWRALSYVAELKRYIDLINLRAGKHSLDEAFYEAAQEICEVTRTFDTDEDLTQGPHSRVHKRTRSPHWAPSCHRRRFDDRDYLVLDSFIGGCFGAVQLGSTDTKQAKEEQQPPAGPTTFETEDVPTKAPGSNAVHPSGSAVQRLRDRIAALPPDLSLLISDCLRELHELSFRGTKGMDRTQIDEKLKEVSEYALFRIKSICESGSVNQSVNPVTHSVLAIAHGTKVTEGINKKWDVVTQSGFNAQKHGVNVWTAFLSTPIREFIASVPKSLSALAAGEHSHSVDELDELEKQFQRQGVHNVEDAIKKDGIGRLLDSWASHKPEYKEWLKKIQRSQGQLQDVTRRIQLYRRWYLPQLMLEGRQSSKLVTNMLYRQTLVWAGMPFCPWLPFVAVLLEVLIFATHYLAMMGGAYRTPNEPWSAGQTTSAFVENYMITLLFCAIPVTMWLNVTPQCGPHEGVRVIDTFYELYLNSEIREAESNEEFETTAIGMVSDAAMQTIGALTWVVRYLMNPPFLMLFSATLLARIKLKTEAMTKLRAKFTRTRRYLRVENTHLQQRLENNYVSAADKVMQIEAQHEALHDCVAAVLRSDAQNSHRLGSQRMKALSDNRNKTYQGVNTRVWTVPRNIGEDDQRKVNEHFDLSNYDANHNFLLWIVHDVAGQNRPMLYFNHMPVQLVEAGTDTAGGGNAGAGSGCLSAAARTTQYFTYKLTRPEGKKASDVPLAGGKKEILITLEQTEELSQCSSGAMGYCYELSLGQKGLYKKLKGNFSDGVTIGDSGGGGHAHHPAIAAELRQSMADLNKEARATYRVRVNDWSEVPAEVDAETKTAITEQMVMQYRVTLLLETYVRWEDELPESATTEDAESEWRLEKSETLGRRWCRHSDILNLHETFRTCLKHGSPELRKLEGFPMPESHHHRNLHHLPFRHNHKELTRGAIKETATRIEEYLNNFLPRQDFWTKQADKEVQLHAIRNPYFLSIVGMLGSRQVTADVDEVDAEGATAADPQNPLHGWSFEQCADWVHAELLCEEGGQDDDNEKQALRKVFALERIDGEEVLVMTRKRLELLIERCQCGAGTRQEEDESRALSDALWEDFVKLRHVQLRRSHAR
jgi:hypothetical protein